MRSVAGPYHRCVAETLTRFDGFVAKYVGDGVLVYFGYPRAHEDDAERAVRGGLALIEAVGKLRSESPLKVRIGPRAWSWWAIGRLRGGRGTRRRGRAHLDCARALPSGPASVVGDVIRPGYGRGSIVESSWALGLLG